MAKKRGCRKYRQPLEMPTPPRGRRQDYIALLVVVDVVLVVVAFIAGAFISGAFISGAFISGAFISVPRFSSTFIVLLAFSLLLQAETARAAPATRIRARIQDSLFIAICSGFPRRRSHGP